MNGYTLITPAVYFCAICGIQVPSGVSHSCAGGISASNLPQPPPHDFHHWLYKAGYEQGRRDAERERDLSPLGKRK